MTPLKPSNGGFLLRESPSSFPHSLLRTSNWLWVKTNAHFGADAPPILEPSLVGIESDVHWGYDLVLTHG